MAIIGWDPFQELAAIREQMDRLLSWRLADRQGTWAPALDVIERPNEVVLRLELPGVDPDGVRVHLQDSTLTVSGERRLEERQEEETTARIERRFGPFERRITLPPGIDAEQVTAEYTYGVLELRVPRKSKAQPQRIEIRRRDVRSEAGEQAAGRIEEVLGPGVREPQGGDISSMPTGQEGATAAEAHGITNEVQEEPKGELPPADAEGAKPEAA